MNGPAFGFSALPDGRPDPGALNGSALNMPPDRELPVDSPAEQSLIGCALGDDATLAAAAAAGIEAGHFYVDGHDRIWSTILALSSAGQPIDAYTVFDALEAAGKAEECGGLDYLLRLHGCVMSSRGAPGYAAAVRQAAAQRDLVRGLEASIALARDGEIEKAAATAGEFIDRSRTALTPPVSRFKLVAAADFGALPRMAWHVHSLLPTTGVAGIFGPSGAAKSFLTLDLMAAIAERREWFGHRTKPCRIVYVVLEGEAGFRRRVAAWEAHNDRPFPPDVLFLFGDFHLTSRNDVLGLAAALDAAGGVERLIVIDTLNRAAPGVDENSPDGMGRILEGVKELQATTGGLVLLVHHAGKDAAKGMRGHSSLFAALDAAIEVTRTDGRREWKAAKVKDGEDGKAHAFSLHNVDLGEDEDSEPVTSCVVEPEQQLDDAPVRVKLPTSGNRRIVYDALAPLFTASRNFGKEGAPPARPCLDFEAAVEAARDRLTVEPKRRSERTRLAITGLVSSGIFGHNAGWIWLK